MRQLARGFTIMELLVAVVVLAVLSSIAMAGYQGYQDKAAILVCETNLKVCQAAVKLYAYDNNSAPGSLADLRPQDYERAYALVTDGKEPYTLLAYVMDTIGVKTAEAVPLPPRYYQNNPNFLHCPIDRKSRPNALYSYQINSAFSGQPLANMNNPANATSILLFESDITNPAGANPDTQMKLRHRGGHEARGIAVNGKQARKNNSSGSAIWQLIGSD